MSVEKIGYFGLIVPKYNVVQGCFLLRPDEPYADSLLEELRASPSMSQSIEVTQPFANGQTPLDNQIIGLLAQTFYIGFQQGKQDAFVAASALSKIINTRFFWIRIEHQSENVSETNISLMPSDVTTVDHARKCFYRLPEVQVVMAQQMMERMRKLMAQMTEDDEEFPPPLPSPVPPIVLH